MLIRVQSVVKVTYRLSGPSIYTNTAGGLVNCTKNMRGSKSFYCFR
jgi:hypothetical protein